MKYKIIECRPCGLKQPGVIVRGFVDNQVSKVAIRSGESIIKEELLEVSDEERVFFHIETLLPRTKEVELLFYTDKIEKIIPIRVDLMRRVMNFIKKKTNSSQQVIEPQKMEIYPFDERQYNEWVSANREEMTEETHFEYEPLISLAIPVYNVERKYLVDCLDSILNQTYQNFEVCLADDCSTKQETIDTLNEYAAKDERIKVKFREENGHISRATNTALEMASGEFIGLADNDDLLEKHALAEVVKALNDNKALDFIYTDEDKLTLSGKRIEPSFKQNFAIDTFLSSNYICHFSVVRKSIIDKIGGFRIGYEGAQDYDLFLRVVKETDKIYHIPKLLYRWKKIPGSTAATISNKSYAIDAGKISLEDYFASQGIKAKIEKDASASYIVSYPCDKELSVTIVLWYKGKTQKLYDTLNNLMYTVKGCSYNVCVVAEAEDQKLDLADYDNAMKIDFVPGIKELNEFLKNQTSDCVLFWTQNSRMLESYWLKTMGEYAMREEFGAISSILYSQNMSVKETGAILVNGEYLLPVREDNVRRAGSPINYCIVGSRGYVVNRNLLLAKGGLDESLDSTQAHYELQLRLLTSGKRNIVMPQVKFQYIGNMPNSIQIEKSICEKTISQDSYYNPNFSTQFAYRLPR